MRRRADRYTMDLTVELFAAGEAQSVGLHDLSRSGMFLRMAQPLPAGESVHVAMYFEGRQLAVPATVVHALTELDARSLGRRPGIGVAFDAPQRHNDILFVRAVDRLLARHDREVARGMHVVVGDPSTRLLERLSTELAAGGCTVATAPHGIEVVGARMRKLPDVVVVDHSLAALDGNQGVAQGTRRH